MWFANFKKNFLKAVFQEFFYAWYTYKKTWVNLSVNKYFIESEENRIRRNLKIVICCLSSTVLSRSKRKGEIGPSLLLRDGREAVCVLKSVPELWGSSRAQTLRYSSRFSRSMESSAGERQWTDDQSMTWTLDRAILPGLLRRTTQLR